jgi:cold shock CspA family protein
MKEYLFHYFSIVLHDYSQVMTIRGGNVIQETERRLCGVVKWFDPSKGFGFIVADGTQDDILLHANVLRNFGQSSVADNAQIEFIAQGTTKGVQATVVLSIAPPETTSASLADFENFDDAEVAQLPLEAARVKWFVKPRDLDLPIFGEVQRTCLCMSISYGGRVLRIYKQARRWQSV